MGDMNLMDSGEKNYAIQTRVRKWYCDLYNWSLNMAMVQAWKLWRIHKKENRQAREQEQLDNEVKEDKWKDRVKELKAKLDRVKERTTLEEKD